jgi:hypothetical protein
VPCNYKLIFEALLGGWIHREVYGGKYLLDFKEVSDKLMIRFDPLCSWASALESFVG